MSLRAFTKRLEAFLEFHFKILPTKTRDQKGMLCPGVKLKSVNFTASPLVKREATSHTNSGLREDQLVAITRTLGGLYPNILSL